MSSSKAALKAINESVRQGKFDDVVKKAKDLLNQDPQNYQAHIFLGFALDKQRKFGEARDAYLAATQIRPDDPQAWQGLVKVYDQLPKQNLDGYRQAVIRVATFYHGAEDLYRAQDIVDKFVDHARAVGDPPQIADALWVQLPESPLFPLLEGRFPSPAHTYERIAGRLEDFERKRINTLIGERRTRIGARLNLVTLEARREVLGQSQLEHVYRQLINWTNDDDLRRTYEEKLLQHCYDALLVWPPGEKKDSQLKNVLSLARDMVAINHPCRLAWDIVVNWQDSKDVEALNVNVLMGYCGFFPESSLYKVITSYLTSSISPFKETATQSNKKTATSPPNKAPEEDSEDDDDDGGVPTAEIPVTDAERLFMMTDGIVGLQSVLGFRLAGELLIHFREYENAAETMRKATALLAKDRDKTGMLFQNTQDAYDVTLGTALVYYQSPRHHQEAKKLFDSVLAHDTSSNAALVGIGLIYEEEEDYDQAEDFLTRALSRDATNVRIRAEAAWVKALKGNWDSARAELRHCLEDIQTHPPVDKDLLAETQYRLGTCVWNAAPERAARKSRKSESAYAYWLLALHNNLEHAATYTSLGIFYHDYAKDKKRARRCFQKALELSSIEVIAAERLARSFADDGDWTRVELVAQRIVRSGKVKPPPGSSKKGISWPFAALGVAELNKQAYQQAIVSFQTALRISPDDYHSWVGLGESYYNSGRYIAATKSIMNAQKLEAESENGQVGASWFAKFMLANIKSDLGDFDEAIQLYREVIVTHPDEDGVIIAMMQTMVENALMSIERGFFGKAAELAKEVIEYAQGRTGNIVQTFNFWRTLGDACSVFSSVQGHTADLPIDAITALLEGGDQEAFNILSSVDKVGNDIVLAKGLFPKDEQLGVDLTRAIHATILCHKRAIHVSHTDVHAQAVAYYNLGWAEYRAHICLPFSLRKKPNSYIKAAVRAFKRAIELEAGNAEFWNSLGVVTSEVNPAVSQHSFVRSLHLDERSPVAWTNLGVLALLANDLKVANEAFSRAQSNDPGYAHAWLGQGFIALLHGDVKEARGIFTHAMDIAEASSIPTRQHYSSSLFDHVLTAPAGMSVASLIQPLFALNQLQSIQPSDVVFGHLAALFQERIRDHPHAVEVLETICSTIEADYEVTESARSLARFTLAKTDLARAYLAVKSYRKAAEYGKLALELSSDETESELNSEQRKKARLSAHLTVGLAKYYLHRYDDAISYFEAALEESDGNPDATCLLAQVLWAQGSEDGRDRARSCLFEVIEKHPDHVQSVLLLGVIALLDNDEDSLEAVLEELHGLRINNNIGAVDQAHISEVLQAISLLGPGKTKQDVLTQVQNDIMLHPFLPHGWSGLAKLTGSKYAAEQALQVTKQGIPPRGTLEAQDLAKAYSGTGKISDAQRATFLAPWEQDQWEALAAAAEEIS